jgi:site-specific DNA-methyltransferase (adenine-specific)
MMLIYNSPHATLYTGDALTVMRELPNGSVDAVIADTPYSSGGTTSSDRTNQT